ncbi:LacI family DNA-binding transcriptional regulator [Stackebrandtia nassauensis]|uniref:Transcriptional regulator, LacI family n=1 Tax=Stackebrandtia nassauensis (strain DSM 44728 / CIP 108903 / NRRL B-16338 / NBRC 102104 / LLR-40K-21) TaxID=446470 RepID=D3PY57_STANL|nr:LacI family DNA-binding transcriptional regulator [Stackebrandtia nassauensis]ADD45386.1 transcriptional regulator, LacI family [Stackebrandtia nassauensis DSM 44728]
MNQTPARRATIRDVARRAGVSVATASRVLSESSYPVSDRMRSKVLRAVHDMDYVVNAHARALSGVRPKMVAMVSGSMSSPFYSDIAAGVAEAAAEDDRLCMYASSQGEADTELAIVSLMREQQADAVILIGGVVPTEEYAERMTRYAESLAAAGSRLVLCGRPGLAADIGAFVVTYDNADGAFAIISHLAERGHRRILHLAGNEGNTTAEDRVQGCRRALAAHGIDENPGLTVYGNFNRASGYERMKRRLAHGCDFTAVFCADDTVAAGAMRALTEAGLRVPQDVSVVGYNDCNPAPDLTPSLTTVHIPAHELGRAAVRLALADNPVERQVTLGTHIVIRNSVAAPP